MKYSDVIVMLLIAVVMFLGGLFVGMSYFEGNFTFTLDYEKAPAPEIAAPPIQPAEQEPETAPAPAPSPVIIEPEPVSPEPIVPETGERLVGEWSGGGFKITENFVIEEGPWTLEWSSVPETMDGQSVGMLKIQVYDVDNPSNPPVMAANTMEETSDITYIEQTGKFFLIINGVNTDWTVSVVAP